MKITKRGWSRGSGARMAALAMITLTAACGDDPFTPGNEPPRNPGPGSPGSVAVAAVEVEPGEIELLDGDTVTLRATARGADGQALSGRSIAWESWDTTVVRVNAQGVLTAVRAGRVTVAAKSEGRQGVTQVTVRERAWPVAAIGIIHKGIEVAPGETFHLGVALVGTNGKPIPSSTREITWTSSDESIVSVGAGGAVTGRRMGTATITVTSEGQSAQTTVTVPSHTRHTLERVDGKRLSEFEQTSFHTDSSGVVWERRVRIRGATLSISTESNHYNQHWQLEVAERKAGANPGPWTTQERGYWDWGTYGYHWLSGELVFESQRLESYGFRTQSGPFVNGDLTMRIPEGGPTPHRMYYTFRRYP